MNSKKSTKRALISSVLSLALCMTMLIGTTFAWFTDSVTSSNNKIVSGNLDVDLYMWDKDATDGEVKATEITDESAPIFGGEESLKAQNNAADTLWEPGKTQVVYLSIKNNGSLDLKYKVAIDVDAQGSNLYEVMKYAITPNATYGNVTSWNANDGVAVTPGVNATASNDVALMAGQEHFFALSIHMDEEAGNEYQNGKVAFDIKVLAGQLASEEDSFGSDYDVFAAYPGTGFAPAPTGNETAKEIPILNKNDFKVGSVVVPADAVKDGIDKLEASIVESDYVGNFTVADGMTSQAFDIKVDGLKDNNDVPVKVTVLMPHSLNPDTFKLYHYDTEITDFVYDPYTGYVIFETATFSPFTIVYDADSKYVPPVVDEDGVQFPSQEKIATVFDVNNTPGYAGCDEEWGSYGQWSPTPNMQSQLEAAYKFVCPTDGSDETYMNWYCDFYVKLDRDLEADQIFLGGNYGSWGWVGFHNGEFTLEAGKELGILESVTTNPWTYAQVKAQVGEFICGVGDVNDALSGAKFTVMLRLTNPETNVSYDVATVTHTFN